MRGALQAEQLRERVVDARFAARGIVRDGDAQGEHIQNRLDLGGALPQICTKLADELHWLERHGLVLCIIRLRASAFAPGSAAARRLQTVRPKPETGGFWPPPIAGRTAFVSECSIWGRLPQICAKLCA